jgi:hypothetical protein
VVAILVFAAAGKSSHDEHGGAVEVLVIAWPFVAGAVLGWGAHLAVRRTAPVPPAAGLWVLAGAVGGGHLLRVVTGRGTAASFVVVSVVVLGVLLVGWRALARLVTRRVNRLGPR